jgi:hypothetical protein
MKAGQPVGIIYKLQRERCTRVFDGTRAVRWPALEDVVPVGFRRCRRGVAVVRHQNVVESEQEERDRELEFDFSQARPETRRFACGK